MIILFFIMYIPTAEIDSALSILNLNRRTIEFERLGWTDSELILPKVRELMNQPLSGEEYSDRILSAIYKSPESLLRELSFDLNVKIENLEVSIESYDDLKSILCRADKIREEAFRNLTRMDRLILLSELPGRWENEDDSTDNWLRSVFTKKYDFDIDTSCINDDTVMKIFRKIDMEKLLNSGILLFKITKAIPFFLNNISDDSLPRILKTERGKIIIGKKGNDNYKAEKSIIIEPGGDDRYIDCGGVVGLIDTLTWGINLIVDLEGNDTYYSEEIVTIGSGLGGIAIVYDDNGDDFYSATHYSIASGYMGFGMILDKAGNDVYRGGIFSLGAANFGIGLLLDYDGSDIYTTLCYGEGFASTCGYGMLADFKGSDIYYAGGRYYHKPLHPEFYQSLSQGFSIGIRPDWGGGIGFLWDGEGNDFYNADIFAQGSSYWCSAGFLIDEKGQDRYLSTEYAQGAGIHLSYGYLMDLKGDDLYFSRFGPSLGEGHDFSCGILVDSSGNDWYSVSGGIGIGLYNSFGLFCDCSGEDIYNITEKLGIGDVKYGRGFSGVGIFLDLSGRDQYPYSRGSDNLSWINNDYGIGVDVNSSMITPGVKQREIPDFSGMTVQEIFNIASEWGVGDNRDRVREARNILGKRGVETIDYIFNNKINTEDGLEFRAIKAAFKDNRDSLIPYFRKYISNSNDKIRRNIYLLIGELKLSELSDQLLGSLSIESNDRNLRTAIYSIGELEDERASQKLINFMQDNEMIEIYSISALGKIGDTISIKNIFKRLKNPYVTVRSSAKESLVKFDTVLIPYIEKRIESDFIPELLVLGAEAVKCDTGNSRRKMKKILYDFLEDEDWIKRLYSARGLSILGGKDVMEKFEILIDSEPFDAIRGVMELYLKREI